MIASLHNGVTALKSLTQGLQVLGNNISNVNSTPLSEITKETRAKPIKMTTFDVVDNPTGPNRLNKRPTTKRVTKKKSDLLTRNPNRTQETTSKAKKQRGKPPSSSQMTKLHRSSWLPLTLQRRHQKYQMPSTTQDENMAMAYF